MGAKRLSIIVPSYNDARIARALRSVRDFDDLGVVRLVIIDGGSNSNTRRLIEAELTADDVLISESDDGIFDALNKGLQACTTDFVGWLGSDDLFTGRVKSSYVLSALEGHDLFVANLAFFRGSAVTRVTHSWPCSARLDRFGLHNPHFATFGTVRLLGSERFTVGNRASDIEYFLRIFAKRPRVTTLNVVATLQAEGGYSTRSLSAIISSNLELISVFGRFTHWSMGPAAVIVKLSYKALSRLVCALMRLRVEDFLVGGAMGDTVRTL